MQLENGVFVAKTVGEFDNMDARTWANGLRKNETASALLDMTEVNRVCPTVPKLVAELNRLPNLRTLVILISPNISSQNQRVIDKLAENAHVRIMTNADDARRLAEIYANKTSGGAGVPAYTRAAVYSASYASNFTFAASGW
jgi:dihydroorotate dehydrogenase